MNRPLAFSLAALPFVVAFGLYATGTLERIDNALENRSDRAWLRMWHECPPGYCEQGEFEAEAHGKPPDAVYALEVVRRSVYRTS